MELIFAVSTIVFCVLVHIFCLSDWDKAGTMEGEIWWAMNMDDDQAREYRTKYEKTFRKFGK